MSQAPEKKKEEILPVNQLLPADLTGKPQEYVRELARENCRGRRAFLGACVLGGGALVSGQAAYAAVRYFFSTGQKIEEVPTPVVKAQIGAAGRTIAYGARKVIVIQTGGGEYRAFDAACTHLGCLVQWQAEKQQFYCPCHTGLFDGAGKNVSGPPPRPLEAIRVKDEGERVIVGAKE
jgi:cytochrome b6-f complex iron-sulfur subunit